MVIKHQVAQHVDFYHIRLLAHNWLCERLLTFTKNQEVPLYESHYTECNYIDKRIQTHARGA